MKLLLLLFLLSPFMLFGQTRRKDIVDSIKAQATNLQRISEVVSKTPGTRVEDIQVSDSGEYVTLTVRVHITELMVVLPLLPVAKIKTRVLVADTAEPVTLPPLPPDIEADVVTTLPPLTIFTQDIPVADMESVVVPPLPDVLIDPTVIPLLAVTTFSIDTIAVVKPDTVNVPPLPDVLIDPIVLPFLAVINFSVEDIHTVRVDTITVPPLPDVPPEPKSLSVLTVIQLSGEDIATGKANTILLPFVPNIELATSEELTLIPSVDMAIANRVAGRMDTVAVPDFEQKKMPVAGMHLSDDGYSLLEKLEGFSPKLYSLMDGGFTIGFGFFVTYGELSKWNKGVTWEDAEQMIRQKVPTYEDQVKQYINVPLTQNAFDALTMLAYNLGGFAKATSIVNDVNRQADYDKLQSDWKRFVHSKAPGVARGLMNRRKDELGVRNESDYQHERKIQILKK